MTVLDAVLEDDVSEFLDHLAAQGLEIADRCTGCGNVVDPVAAGGFRRDGSRLLVVCERAACLAALLA